RRWAAFWALVYCFSRACFAAGLPLLRTLFGVGIKTPKADFVVDIGDFVVDCWHVLVGAQGVLPAAGCGLGSGHHSRTTKCLFFNHAAAPRKSCQTGHAGS